MAPKGRGRSKKSPRNDGGSLSNRVRKKSRKQIESEEYLSASETPDIVISNGNETVDTIQQYEDSFLDDNIFEDEIVDNIPTENKVPLGNVANNSIITVDSIELETATEH